LVVANGQDIGKADVVSYGASKEANGHFSVCLKYSYESYCFAMANGQDIGKADVVSYGAFKEANGHSL